MEDKSSIMVKVKEEYVVGKKRKSHKNLDIGENLNQLLINIDLYEWLILKSTTVPIPALPMLENLQVFPYPCQTIWVSGSVDSEAVSLVCCCLALFVVSWLRFWSHSQVPHHHPCMLYSRTTAFHSDLTAL